MGVQGKGNKIAKKVKTLLTKGFFFANISSTPQFWGVTQSTSSVSTKEKRKVLKKGVDKVVAMW